jgi:hypothetical protein
VRLQRLHPWLRSGVQDHPEIVGVTLPVIEISDEFYSSTRASEVLDGDWR